jgi:hypothetical protein
MSTYAFRIICKLAGDYDDFEITEGKIPLVLPAFTSLLHVSLPKAKDRTAGRTLILESGVFSLEEEARAAGAPVRTVVILAGLLLGVGIDVGTDQPECSIPRLADGQPNERVHPYVHGLQVMPEIDGLMFVSLSAGLVRKKPISPGDFEEAIAKSYALTKGLTKKQTLAAKLYSQSHFQSSDAARFLTLISAIEALAERQRRVPATVALVESMIEKAATAGDLDESERKSLTDGLGNLKRESISSACRALVRTYCGDPAAEDFTRMYNIRSELLHKGEPPPGTDFALERQTLGPLVRRLIMRHMVVS